MSQDCIKRQTTVREFILFFTFRAQNPSVKCIRLESHLSHSISVCFQNAVSSHKSFEEVYRKTQIKLDESKYKSEGQKHKIYVCILLSVNDI